MSVRLCAGVFDEFLRTKAVKELESHNVMTEFILFY